MADESKTPNSSGTSGTPPTPRKTPPSDAHQNPLGQNPRERRTRRRALISAPVRVRSLYAGSNAPDEISTTVDVSRNGILFISARAGFSRGAVVAVTFPFSKSAAALQAEQSGRVVRVTPLPEGRFSIAVALGASSKHDRDAAVVSTADPALAAGGSTETGNEPPLVIVVDADASVRESLRSLLVGLGYEVMALQSARQAHAALNQLLPSLLIAEIEGEELPGYDLCARIKSTPRLERVPVVLTTQSAYPSDYSNAHSLGAVVCLAKPFRPERIAHVVRLLIPRTGARGLSGNNPSAGPAKGRAGSGDSSFRLRR